MRNMGKVIRAVRVLLASFVLLAFTAMFLDFTGVAAGWFSWLREMQFMPAVLAGSAVALALLLVSTLVAGRVYCSVLCPLGILQDFARLVTFGRRRDLKSRAKPCGAGLSVVQGWTRIGFLLVFAGGGLLGLHFAWLDPYAIYGRFVSACITPFVKASPFAQSLADWADGRGLSFTHVVEVAFPAAGFIVLAGGVVAIVVVLAAWRGRAWCNTVCPVGTVLGALSKFAWLRPRIDEKACVSCRMCERTCRAHCISIDAKEIDHTKCVSCMDCSAVCPKGAIKWRR